MEAGMGKVMGVNQRRLVRQFLSEALVTCFFAALMGILLADLLLPRFNDLAEKQLLHGSAEERASPMCNISLRRVKKSFFHHKLSTSVSPFTGVLSEVMVWHRICLLKKTVNRFCFQTERNS